MRKYLMLIPVLMLLILAAALAEGAQLTLYAPTETVRPGKAVTLTFDAPEAGSAALTVTDEAGQTVSVVMEAYAAVQGRNTLWWNGTYQGVPAPEGTYQLVLTLNGETVSAPITIGSYAPYLTGITPSGSMVTPDQPITVDFYASVDGSLTIGAWVGGAWRSLETVPVREGLGSIDFSGAGLGDGEVALTLTLSDATGYPSNEEHINVTLTGFTPKETAPPAPTEAPTPEPTAEMEETAAPEDEGVLVSLEEVPDQRAFTPAYGSPYQADTGMNYWNLPMDITDEAAVWEMLMQPITVISGNEKTQLSLRAEPDENSDKVGVVTRATQGVHVLETLDNGWSLVECYSSSFHDSAVKAWNMLVQGYVKTSELTTVTPQTSYAIVIDKLTQKLYLFKDGGLYSTLDVSTGLANERQPYNETRSGEFLLTSAVGGFKSDNMYCPRAIRFDDGDLLHEVPYVERADGSKIYSATEPYLGQKASHGCVRVQRNRTPEGVNMQWLWDNRKKNTKLVIWEDWQGRQITVPEDDFLLYYNPSGGTYYHSQETCYSAKSGMTFTPFTYGELETGDFAKLKRCPYCAPVLREAQILEINETYAPGGDHDPVLTAAREKYLNGEYD